MKNDSKNCNIVKSKVEFSISQINKLKPGIKNGTEKTLKLSSNVVGDSSYENNFLHNFQRQVSKLFKAFANNYSANIKLSKTQLHKKGQ